MRSIQEYLPNPHHTEINRIFVNAKPEVAWQVTRRFDMSEVPWMRLLFAIRTLPDKLSRKGKTQGHEGLGVDDITRNNTGFMILHETPGKEVVVGSVGQFWHLKIPFRKLSPGEFQSFHEPGYGKLAWAISVEPFNEGSTVSIELRITATDEKSWKKLNEYYHVIGIGSKLIRMSAVAHLESELGKMRFEDDADRTLAGDSLMPGATYSLTTHRDIEAPVSIVWRYLMQLGCDRAGWYSIDALDNGGRKSTDHLVEEWTDRHIGDKLAATPAGDGYFNVYSIEPGKHFVIAIDAMRSGHPFTVTWAFVLESIGEDATRLTTRARIESSPTWSEWLMGNIIYPPLHGLMEHVQLDTIKRLAERNAHARIHSGAVTQAT